MTPGAVLPTHRLHTACPCLRVSLWGLALLVAASLPACASGRGEPPTITVTGRASQERTPDEAVLHVTVHQEGKKLATVKAEHDRRVRTLERLAARHDVAEKHLTTRHARIQPRYRYEEGTRIFRGYRAVTAVEITVSDLAMLAPMMQALTEDGFSRISGVRYRLADREAAREALLTRALKHARAKARRMAAVLDRSLGPALSIREGRAEPDGSPPFPGYRQRATAARTATGSNDATAPPKGSIALEAYVTVDFRLE